MARSKTQLVGGWVEPHVASKVEKVLITKGVSKSEYVRSLLLGDLERLGLLKP